MAGCSGHGREPRHHHQQTRPGALKASEERYRDLFENATDLIQSVDAEWRFQYVNTAGRDTLGFEDPDSQRASRIWDIVHPEEAGALPGFFGRVLRGRDRWARSGPCFVARDGREITCHAARRTRGFRTDGP
jgi:PAS domain S-box-containing protein